ACIMGGMGFRGERWQLGSRLDAALFGEAPSRIVVSASPRDVPALEALVGRHRVPIARLGVTGGQRCSLANLADLSLDEITQAWRGGLAGAGG
ncbi:MAG: phosphoribosylformylglycinamidine synthase II, partial [Dehalococcoidia bacterium]|nr:phosphoribosylformylglycinamidine synthase II [Dehalococcoidia bacterium]